MGEEAWLYGDDDAELWRGLRDWFTATAEEKQRRRAGFVAAMERRRRRRRRGWAEHGLGLVLVWIDCGGCDFWNWIGRVVMVVTGCEDLMAGV